MQGSTGPPDLVSLGSSRTLKPVGSTPHATTLGTGQACAGVLPTPGRARAEGCEAEQQHSAQEAACSPRHRSPSDSILASVKMQQPVSLCLSGLG